MPGTAAGFYAAQARVENRVFITNVDVGFDTDGNRVLDLTVLARDL